MNYAFLVAWCLASLLTTVRSQVESRRSRPFFTATKTNVTYSVGDTATLRCGVRDRGSRTISWRRLQEVTPLTLGTFTYVGDPRITSTHNKFKHQWNLHIENVQMKDTGVYECQVSTKQAMVRHFSLNVLERQLREIPKPGTVYNTPAKGALLLDIGYIKSVDIYGSKVVAPRVEDKGTIVQALFRQRVRMMANVTIYKGVVVSGTDILEVGQPLSLTCNATGKTNTPRDVEWFKGSERVRSNSRTLVAISKSVSEEQKSLVSYLVIKRSRIEDSGTYLCRSSEKDTGTISVHVLNAATFNVKRGTEKKDKTRGSVKKQLQPQGSKRGYYNIPTTDRGKKKDQDSQSQQSQAPSHKRNDEPSFKGNSSRLSPLTFQPFVLILLLLYGCAI